MSLVTERESFISSNLPPEVPRSMDASPFIPLKTLCDRVVVYLQKFVKGVWEPHVFYGPNAEKKIPYETLDDVHRVGDLYLKNASKEDISIFEWKDCLFYCISKRDVDFGVCAKTKEKKAALIFRAKFYKIEANKIEAVWDQIIFQHSIEEDINKNKIQTKYKNLMRELLQKKVNNFSENWQNIIKSLSRKHAHLSEQTLQNRIVKALNSGKTCPLNDVKEKVISRSLSPEVNTIDVENETSPSPSPACHNVPAQRALKRPRTHCSPEKVSQKPLKTVSAPLPLTTTKKTHTRTPQKVRKTTSTTHAYTAQKVPRTTIATKKPRSPIIVQDITLRNPSESPIANTAQSLISESSKSESFRPFLVREAPLIVYVEKFVKNMWTPHLHHERTSCTKLRKNISILEIGDLSVSHLGTKRPLLFEQNNNRFYFIPEKCARFGFSATNEENSIIFRVKCYSILKNEISSAYSYIFFQSKLGKKPELENRLKTKMKEILNQLVRDTSQARPAVVKALKKKPSSISEGELQRQIQQILDNHFGKENSVVEIEQSPETIQEDQMSFEEALKIQQEIDNLKATIAEKEAILCLAKIDKNELQKENTHLKESLKTQDNQLERLNKETVQFKEKFINLKGEFEQKTSRLEDLKKINAAYLKNGKAISNTETQK